MRNLLEICKAEVRHKYPPEMDAVDRQRLRDEALDLMSKRYMNELMTGFLNEMAFFTENAGNAYSPVAEVRIAEQLHNCVMGMCVNRLLHSKATKEEIAAELECNPVWSIAAFKAWNTMYTQKGGRRDTLKQQMRQLALRNPEVEEE